MRQGRGRCCSRLVQIGAGAVAVWVAVFPLRAAEPDPDAFRFEIRSYAVSGSNLLPVEEVQALLLPFVGPSQGFSRVQQALEALEQRFHERGFALVQVVLPEQDVTRGVVRLRVIEPLLGTVGITSNRHVDTARIRRSLPALRAGETPNSQDIARNLRLAAENPARQLDVILRPGTAEGQVHAQVRATDHPPWRVTVFADNAVEAGAGGLRFGAGFRHASLFDSDHVFTVRHVLVPGDRRGEGILAGSYHIPFYKHYSALRVTASHSSAGSALLPDLPEVRGSGDAVGLRWIYLQRGRAHVEQQTELAVDYRGYRADTQGTPALLQDVSVWPVSLGYGARWQLDDMRLAFSLGVTANLAGAGSQADFTRARPGARADFSLLRYGLNMERDLSGGWVVRAAMRGQSTAHALVAGERLGLGGPESIRGYRVREVTGDRGYHAGIEFHTPVIAAAPYMPASLPLRLMLFINQGRVTQAHGLPGLPAHSSLSSAGLGVHLKRDHVFRLRVHLARTLRAAGGLAGGRMRLDAGLEFDY